jgi:hypothetical protein
MRSTTMSVQHISFFPLVNALHDEPTYEYLSTLSEPLEDKISDKLMMLLFYTTFVVHEQISSAKLIKS